MTSNRHYLYLLKLFTPTKTYFIEISPNLIWMHYGSHVLTSFLEQEGYLLKTNLIKFCYKLPEDPERCRKWTTNLRRDNFTPSKCTVICFEHFHSSCYDRTGQTVRLRPNAEPTLFQFPEHLIMVMLLRKYFLFLYYSDGMEGLSFSC